MTTPLRTKMRTAFGDVVNARPFKIQVGARGQKNGTTWTAIDLFDTSPLIDYNWDLQNLPLENCTVDCFVCNAVLEHVPRPDLAVYEMLRTLKVGGQVWIEVPFLQFYHAHPHDFMRWTLPGVRMLMEDFREVASGIAGDAGYEIPRYLRYANTDARLPADEALEAAAVKFVAERLPRWGANPRFYSSVFFWGEKTTEASAEKAAYMASLKFKTSAEFQQGAGTRNALDR